MRFDFAPLLLVAVLAFVAIGITDLSRSLPGGERGLLRFEGACPIYHTTN